jgi:adenine-specific DNA-methyltransferase
MRYYGGKGKLLDFIFATADQEFGSDYSFSDGFAGTGIVSLEARRRGHVVEANDILYFSHCLGVSNLEFGTDGDFRNVGGLESAVQLLNSLEGHRGFISKHYSPNGPAGRQYFSEANASRIDAIRKQLSDWRSRDAISAREIEGLIGLLLRGVNRVSNVTGTYGAYLKSWDPRANKELYLDVLEMNRTGPEGKSFNLDVSSFLRQSQSDVLYLDPPYNSRDYSQNYFLLELISSLGDFEDSAPKGKTGIVAFPDKKSKFSSKRSVFEAFGELFEAIQAPVTLLSYSNEGLVTVQELKNLMSEYGRVEVVNRSHKRFRSINQDGSNVKTEEHILALRKA